jgi:type I restriction enzyme, S subunit
VSWPEYPAYKPSGIEWLGAVPCSWRVSEVKLTHDVTLGKMLRTEPGGPSDVLLPYLRAAHIPPTGFTLDDPKEMWFTPREVAELTLKKGDVVVVEGGMGGYGRCDVVPEDLPGWGFQNSINRLRPKNGNCGAYTKYLLQIAREKGFIDVLCSVSTMPHLTAEKLGAIRLPLPTIEEQWAIAEFLDKETTEIDALIGKQEQLIATLREDRTATITHAVTKGLDPEVEMKASGLPWAGDIPRHWQLVPIKHVVQSVGVGLVINPSTYVADSGVPFLLAGVSGLD